MHKVNCRQALEESEIAGNGRFFHQRRLGKDAMTISIQLTSSTKDGLQVTLNGRPSDFVIKLLVMLGDEVNRGKGVQYQCRLPVKRKSLPRSH